MMLHHGDCLEVLTQLPENSVDSLVTDPPAGISFMGKEWDGDKGGRKEWIAWMAGVMRECHRILKPGAHGLVWALPRTSHWTATALEDAGFEIRDVVTHLFGQGFPKSLNIQKAGAGSQWEGWGTALKPASEHWILVRKPCAEKTVAANVLEWGTGGINVDGSRVAAGSDLKPVYSGAKGDKQGDFGAGTQFGSSDKYTSIVSPLGRFPANLVLSHSPYCSDDQCDIECAVLRLDAQSGTLRSGNGPTKRGGLGYQGGEGGMNAAPRPANEGGASRFFYCAKIRPSERGEDNNHPTVKPQKLMRYLCRLITPPGGTVLDPFMGSGSTGIAAHAEGFEFIGIERDAGYHEIATRRIEAFFCRAKAERSG